MDIARRLRQAREFKGISQMQVSKDTGINNKTLSGYERKVSEPDLETLKVLASYYSVSLDYLLGVSDIMDKNVSDKTTTIKEETIPEYFDDPEEARKYIEKHQIFGSNGFELDDEEMLEFANELLQQMKMVSYKYRK